MNSVFIEGDSFHRYDRTEMKAKVAEALDHGDPGLSHFGPAANLFEELEALFRQYGENGRGRVRKYPHDDEEAAEAPYGQPPGAFTPWANLPVDTDLLFYEELHGAVATDEVDVARHVDLLIGVVPVINLEWIQKLQRDKATRGYSTEAVVGGQRSWTRTAVPRRVTRRRSTSSAHLISRQLGLMSARSWRWPCRVITMRKPWNRRCLRGPPILVWWDPGPGEVCARVFWRAEDCPRRPWPGEGTGGSRSRESLAP